MSNLPDTTAAFDLDTTPPPADTITPIDPVDPTSAADPVLDHEPPRTRWAAIVWGLFFAALAAGLLWLVTGAARGAVISDWLATLTPGSIWGLSLLALGILLLVGGAVGLIRRAQLRAATRHHHPRDFI